MIFDLDIQREIKIAKFSTAAVAYRWYTSDHDKYKRNGIFCLFNGSYSSYYICKCDYATLKDKIKNNTIKENINQSATLYFDKSCTFPRYKLQDTNFKRCVKLDKADYIVIPDNVLYFAFSLANNWEREFTHNNITYRFNKEGEEIISKLDKQNYNIQNINIEKYIYTSNKKEGEFIYNVLHVYNKPFIRESDLDRLISKNQEELDYDSLFSIYEMLNSKDSESIELGCKLLPTFNIFSYKLSVMFVLFITQDKWIPNKGSNSVIFKTCLKSLNYPSYGYGNVNMLFRNNPNASEEDKALAKKFAEPWVKKEISKYLSYMLDGCPYKINLNITVE